MKHRYPNFEHSARRRRGRAYRPHTKSDGSVVLQLVTGAAFAGVLAWNVAPEAKSAWATATVPAAERLQIEQSDWYPNCDAARSAGAAPIYRGNAGYRAELDGDSDGVACEPYY